MTVAAGCKSTVELHGSVNAESKILQMHAKSLMFELK